MLYHRQDNARGHMASTQIFDQLVISSTRKTGSNGLVRANHINFSCVIGRSGIGQKAREGDGITPIGCWTMSYFLYRADKIRKPVSFLRGFAINPTDSWCDQASSHRYNQPVSFTLPGSSEALWRSDNLYDIIVVLNHNSLPFIRGRGSAVFIHLCNSESNDTQGCIALDQNDLRKLLGSCGPRTRIVITP